MTRKSIVTIFKKMYEKLIANRKEEVNFWILLFFILTFSFSRIIVYSFPDLVIHVRHVHIHHFAYGIIILALVGFFALNDEHVKRRRVMGSIYGIGLGLSMDEFGMWIRLDDDYWIRHSYDAIFITAAILLYFVYFSGFWTRFFKRITSFIENEEDEFEELR